MIRLVLRVVVVAIVAVALLAGYGAMLPSRHHAASAARFDPSPIEVWEAVTDFAAWPEWRADVLSVERLPDRGEHPVWLVTMKDDHLRMPLEIAESTPLRRLTTVTPPDADLPFSGSWTWQLSEAAPGTLLTIIEDGEIHNPAFRAVAKLFTGYHGTMDGFLVDLGRHLGQEVSPKPVPQGLTR